MFFQKHGVFMDFHTYISKELQLPLASVTAVCKLLEEGNTVPFIARYRKEATGNLDEVQIRQIGEKHTYLKEIQERKETILKSIEEQGKLTDELKSKIVACMQKNTLEDLYLPFKPKRRTRGMIAKEKGLEPLAELLKEGANPDDAAQAFVDVEKGVADIKAALQGARDILSEEYAECADAVAQVRDLYNSVGVVTATACKGKEGERNKYSDYYDFSERIATIPSHRFFALRRGEQERILDLTFDIPDEECQQDLEKLLSLKFEQLQTALKDSLKRLIKPRLETELRVDLKMRSDEEASGVFSTNLKNLLLSAPFGTKGVIGIDPGLRTGCKCAVVDRSGKFIETTTFTILGDTTSAKRTVSSLVQKFTPEAIAVGNGTAGRETLAFVKETLKEAGLSVPTVTLISESGASIYSASDIAREEFPDLDLTIRGAISIARRLQDPLAELVKVDPKSIGVGQYQHDVFQPLLEKKLSEVVESCVNFVGVELNTASARLLSFVAGIGKELAKKIVQCRDDAGTFLERQDLLKVPGMGPRTFQQCAGFLRIQGSKNALDRSAVHPEQYPLVEKMAASLGTSVDDLVGNSQLLSKIDAQQFISDEAGLITIQDVIDELKKPGRDPRSTFEVPNFREDVNKLDDLQVGMKLEGVVTNVTNFGAFVDIGVHQDGLVHISELSDTFIKDPSEVVKSGDKIQVKVLEVDLERKRISLSAKKGAPKQAHKPQKARNSFESSPFAALS
jgi:uncharacterized protein